MTVSKIKRVFVIDQDALTMEMFNKRPGYACTLYDDIEPNIVVFTGGPDVNPLLYGEKKLPGTYPDPQREEENLEYWDKWPAATKVGICFGGQWLNVMSGGAMWQDVDGHGGAHKAINLITIPGFAAYDEIHVTSTHHQMMIPHEKYGETLMIAHRTKNFTSEKQRPKPSFDTEVVWYESTKSLCFQPHPEYPSLPNHREYFFNLLEHLTS